VILIFWTNFPTNVEKMPHSILAMFPHTWLTLPQPERAVAEGTLSPALAVDDYRGDFGIVDLAHHPHHRVGRSSGAQRN